MTDNYAVLWVLPFSLLTKALILVWAFMTSYLLRMTFLPGDSSVPHANRLVRDTLPIFQTRLGVYGNWNLEHNLSLSWGLNMPSLSYIFCKFKQILNSNHMWLPFSIEIIMTYPWVKKDIFTYEKKEFAGATFMLLNYGVWWTNIFTYLWVGLTI